MVEPVLAPEPPRRHPWKWIIAAVVLVVLLCCCGVAVFFGRSALEVGPARSAGDAYLANAQAGNFDSAYGQLCAKARQETSPAELAKLPKLLSYEITNVFVRNHIPRGLSATVTAKLILGDGRTVLQTFNMVKEDGEWKVC